MNSRKWVLVGPDDMMVSTTIDDCRSLTGYSTVARLFETKTQAELYRTIHCLNEHGVLPDCHSDTPDAELSEQDVELIEAELKLDPESLATQALQRLYDAYNARCID